MSKRLKKADEIIAAFDREIAILQEDRDSAAKLVDRRRAAARVEYLTKLRTHFFE